MTLAKNKESDGVLAKTLAKTKKMRES